MNNSKKTRKALLSSIVALMLCFSMFVGTTMAWFTDTATTSVNTIQAGTLDIDLVKEDGVTSLVGETLKFKKSANAPDGEAILWEPGATYELDSFRVANKGNLAAKYKIVVNGTTGDAKLLEAIDFTVNGTAVAVDNFTGTLAAGATSELYTITATMKTTAGNEYQGLSLSGISITVVAGQDTVEFDSEDDQYDANATYGEYTYTSKTAPVVVKEVVEADGTKTYFTEKEVVIAEEDGGLKVTVPADVQLEEDVKDITRHIEIVDTIELPKEVTVQSTEAVEARTIEVSGIHENNEGLIEVVLDGEYKLPAGLTDVKAYSKGVALPRDTATPESNGQYFTYDAATGIVTVYVKHFCNFTFVYNDLPVAIVEKMTEMPTVDGKKLNTAYTFTATETAEQAAASKYAKWHADFVVSVDKDIQEGKEIGLAGEYGTWGWLGFFTTDGFEANKEFRLLHDYGELANGAPVYMNYEELCSLVKVFNCGAYGDGISGTTLTVELRLYETAEKTEENNSVNTETGRYVVVGTYSHTF